MTNKILVCFIMLFLILGCKKIPKEQYDAGWKEATKDACNCNENLVQIDDSEAAKAGFGWSHGYINGCLHFKKENHCK
jgi:hypothetical protein